MKETMFRAVSKETQKYVYGVPIVNSFGSATFIITAVTDSLSFPIERISDFCIEVIPVTLSQYSGFKDKNGKPIYADDEAVGDCGTTYRTIKFHNGKFVYSYGTACADLCDVHEEIEVYGNVFGI
ncbi:hypothetical protein FM106_05815 [Brachybacterium faecium]|nr:hypothetical protein FM106_05815 [Brachybacterium faecium]